MRQISVVLVSIIGVLVSVSLAITAIVSSEKGIFRHELVRKPLLGLVNMKGATASSLNSSSSTSLGSYLSFAKKKLSDNAPFTTITGPYREHIIQVLQGCGEICNTTMVGKPGIFFDEISKQVDCAELWRNSAIDAPRPIGPAPDVPADLKHLFNYNGRVPIVYNPTFGILNQQYMGGKAETPEWKQDVIDQWTQQCGAGRLQGTYGSAATNGVNEGLKMIPDMKGGRVLVVGSENPWVEACCLSAGASHVTTLEYGAIVSRHPRVSTLTPDEARIAFVNGSMPVFDVIVTYSSVEHSGLGRYGDQLNPWGDLQAIARAWCICKEGGYLLLGVMEAPQDRKH
jgi:hypothetical protein